MGYFSNGTEGEWYEEKICSRCAHNQQPDGYNICAVWSIHLLYNYDQHKNETIKAVMDELIPPSDIPGYNDLCNMFQPSAPEYATHGDDYKAWLANHQPPAQGNRVSDSA